MTQPVLRAHNIISGYGKLQVINGIDIHINKGELVTIIGPPVACHLVNISIDVPTVSQPKAVNCCVVFGFIWVESGVM